MRMHSFRIHIHRHIEPGSINHSSVYLVSILGLQKQQDTHVCMHVCVYVTMGAGKSQGLQPASCSSSKLMVQPQFNSEGLRTEPADGVHSSLKHIVSAMRRDFCSMPKGWKRPIS